MEQRAETLDIVAKLADKVSLSHKNSLKTELQESFNRNAQVPSSSWPGNQRSCWNPEPQSLNNNLENCSNSGGVQRKQECATTAEKKVTYSLMSREVENGMSATKMVGLSLMVLLPSQPSCLLILKNSPSNLKT